MALSTILTNMKTIVDAVSGITAKTYTRKVLANDMMTIIDKFKDPTSELIHTWWISRESTKQIIYAQGPKYAQNHKIVIIGFYGLSEANTTENTFQNLIQTMVADFRADDTLSGACHNCTPMLRGGGDIAGLQVDVVEPRTFCGILCHYAELRLYPQELL